MTKEPFVFDPRCSACKEPFGAVVCGEAVTFRCRPLSGEGFTHCALVMHHEFADTVEEFPLTFDGYDEERVRFCATIEAPAEPELVWYHFRLWRDDESGCVLDQSGYHSRTELSPWQLTVYRKSATPEWFGSGVTYQIFPDRFCRLSVPSAEGLIGDRWVHQSWEEMQVWQPENGEIRNRDFFGGSLAGITSKLDDLAALGVTTLYLCPIFESASNHRYNTADYKKIDPLLGTEKDFKKLCAQAKKQGMRVILDGVFNHTGSQSLYFNEDGFYPTLGAAQSQDSPFYEWFSFHPWPEDFDSWWGIKTLPAVREENPSYVDYIIEAKDSVVRRWLKLGASGWRLDVADELPDWFIEKIRTAMDETAPDSLLIGEVWEDGTTKIAYDKRRRYLLGSEVHGLMNYPFRTALLDFLRGGLAQDFQESMETLRENYPPAAFYSAMNFLGTHDTARILTLLGAERTPESKDQRACYRLSPTEREKGTALLRLAAMMLFTFPGSPTIYYGDEVGMEGFEDPFNRSTFPWGHEDRDLQDFFRRLGKLRQQRPSLQKGALRWRYASGHMLAFARDLDGEQTLTVINADQSEHILYIPWSNSFAVDLLSKRQVLSDNGRLPLVLPPRSGVLLA